MTDQERTPVSAAISRIYSAIDTLEQEPASITRADFEKLKDESDRLRTILYILELRFDLSEARYPVIARILSETGVDLGDTLDLPCDSIKVYDNKNPDRFTNQKLP